MFTKPPQFQLKIGSPSEIPASEQFEMMTGEVDAGGMLALEQGGGASPRPAEETAALPRLGYPVWTGSPLRKGIITAAYVNFKDGRARSSYFTREFFYHDTEAVAK